MTKAPVRGDDDVELAPWRDRRFVVFGTGNFINNVGESAFKVTLPLLVYHLTGSLAVMSLLAALIPAVTLLGPWMGSIVDRWGPRVFVVPGLMIQLVGAVALNIAVMNGYHSTPVLFTLAAFVQIGGAMYRAGWMAGVASMFPDNPGRSRAMLSSLWIISNIMGPFLVAAGLGPIGYLGLLWFNVVTFFAPIAVWLMGIHPPRRIPDPDRPYKGLRTLMIDDVLEGWRTVRSEKRVLYVQLTALPLHFVGGVGMTAFVVWYLRDYWEMPADWVSLVQAAWWIGAMVGSLYIAVRSRTRPRLVMACAAVFMTISLMTMAVVPLWGFVICVVLFYTVRTSMDTVTDVVIVKYLPAHMVGRAEGLFGLIGGIPAVIAPFTITLVQGAWGGSAVLIYLAVVSSLSLLLLARFWKVWSVTDGSKAASPQS